MGWSMELNRQSSLQLNVKKNIEPMAKLRVHFSGLPLHCRVLEHGDERHLPRILPLRHLQGLETQPRIIVSCISKFFYLRFIEIKAR